MLKLVPDLGNVGIRLFDRRVGLRRLGAVLMLGVIDADNMQHAESG